MADEVPVVDIEPLGSGRRSERMQRLETSGREIGPPWVLAEVQHGDLYIITLGDYEAYHEHRRSCPGDHGIGSEDTGYWVHCATSISPSKSRCPYSSGRGTHVFGENYPDYPSAFAAYRKWEMKMYRRYHGGMD